MTDGKPQLNTRHYRLNRLASINSARKYLEIGVARGGTFLKVNVASKTAVDPSFKFKIQDHEEDGLSFFETTSDYYFSNLAQPGDKFDLIYLDGLHTFEQTFRDFCASIAHSHAKTIWLIDDTVPISLASSIADQKKFREIKRALNDNRPAWMGDVYKVVFAIHDFFPQYQYATFSSGHGQTALWHSTRKGFSAHWNSLEIISRLGYGDFLLARDLMFFLDDDKLYKSVTEGISKSCDSNDKY